MTDSPKLQRLRQELQDIAETIGREWADKVAGLIGLWTDGNEQELLDEGAKFFEKLCLSHVQDMRQDAAEHNCAAAEADIASFITTARTAFQERIKESVLKMPIQPGRA
jgi:hypothetical protein